MAVYRNLVQKMKDENPKDGKISYMTLFCTLILVTKNKALAEQSIVLLRNAPDAERLAVELLKLS